jgi:hypothetical protein
MEFYQHFYSVLLDYLILFDVAEMLHTTNVTYHNLNELNHDVEIVDFTAV